MGRTTLILKVQSQATVRVRAAGCHVNWYVIYLPQAWCLVIFTIQEPSISFGVSRDWPHFCTSLGSNDCGITTEVPAAQPRNLQWITPRATRSSSGAALLERIRSCAAVWSQTKLNIALITDRRCKRNPLPINTQSTNPVAGIHGCNSSAIRLALPPLDTTTSGAQGLLSRLSSRLPNHV